jgi:uncharacterized protein
MTTLLTTVFVTSLLGSLHCAGMCGPFVLFCVGTESQRPRRHMAVQLAYHGGRLVTYTFLGVVAGLIGRALDEAGSILGFQRIAMISAGALMVIFGLVMLLRVWGVRFGKMDLPEPVRRFFLRGQAFAQSQHPVIRALIIGLLSILLPCGWLYLYVFAAAGTGSPLFGGLTLVAFWLGTVPILAALGVGAQTVLAPIRQHVPTIMAIVLIGAGFLVVLHGVNRNTTPPNRESADVFSLDQAISRVQEIGSKKPPCCSQQKQEQNNSTGPDTDP